MKASVNNKYKAFTSLEQSRKLAEMLPLESADMFWLVLGNTPRVHVLTEPLSNYIQWENYPCWSLASLLGVLPKNLNVGRPSLNTNYKGYYWIQYYDEFMESNNYKTECFNNPVDACVAMIEKLHELNLL